MRGSERINYISYHNRRRNVFKSCCQIKLRSVYSHEPNPEARERAGISAFKRGWDAELTSPGKLYAEEINGLIQHWNFVMDQAKSLKKEEIGTLHIGVIETVAATVLPLVLQQFREHKPNITCHFTVGNTDALANALVDGKLDFAISGEPHSIPSLHFEPVYHEHIAFIVSRNHPFAAKVGFISKICTSIRLSSEVRTACTIYDWRKSFHAFRRCRFFILSVKFRRSPHL